jgi:hypothetical protein
MVSARTRMIVEVIATAVLVVGAMYIVGTTALVAPWALAVACGAVVALMWKQAWTLRASPQASAAIVDLALGVSGMFLALAYQLSRFAEHLSRFAEH